jgi:hypothetical protein
MENVFPEELDESFPQSRQVAKGKPSGLFLIPTNLPEACGYHSG